MYVDIEVQADKYEAELELQKELNDLKFHLFL